jgi:hypothetical protein
MVLEQLVEPETGLQLRTDPESEAGRPLITLPSFIVNELRQHLVTYVANDVDAAVVAGPRDGLPGVVTGRAPGPRPAASLAFPSGSIFMTCATWGPTRSRRPAERPMS